MPMQFNKAICLRKSQGDLMATDPEASARTAGPLSPSVARGAGDGRPADDALRDRRRRGAGRAGGPPDAGRSAGRAMGLSGGHRAGGRGAAAAPRARARVETHGRRARRRPAGPKLPTWPRTSSPASNSAATRIPTASPRASWTPRSVRLTAAARRELAPGGAARPAGARRRGLRHPGPRDGDWLISSRRRPSPTASGG